MQICAGFDANTTPKLCRAQFRPRRYIIDINPRLSARLRGSSLSTRFSLSYPVIIEFYLLAETGQKDPAGLIHLVLLHQVGENAHHGMKQAEHTSSGICTISSEPIVGLIGASHILLLPVARAVNSAATNIESTPVSPYFCFFDAS